MRTLRPRVTNVISRLATEAGLTDADVAARAGISRAHLNRIKNGRVTPRVDTAIAIARALNGSVRAVFMMRPRS